MFEKGHCSAEIDNDKNEFEPGTLYQFAGSSFGRRRHCWHAAGDGGSDAAVAAAVAAAAAASSSSNSLGIQNKVKLKPSAKTFFTNDGSLDYHNTTNRKSENRSNWLEISNL